jgi:hypothetical protein
MVETWLVTTVTLKMATETFAETLDNSQLSTLRISENISFI